MPQSAPPRSIPEAPAGTKAFMDQMMTDLDRKMRADGTVPLTAYLLLKNTAIIPLVFEDDPTSPDAKDAFADFVAIIATALDASCLAIVVEAWSLPQDFLKKVDVAQIMRTGISKHPDRIEVLSAMCHWPDVIVTAEAEIKRKGKAYDGHTEPRWNTFRPEDMRSRFGGIIRAYGVEERREARELMRRTMGSSVENFFRMADDGAPPAN